ncbi:unnamed protein product, partial [marine sediment metagenome]
DAGENHLAFTGLVWQVEKLHPPFKKISCQVCKQTPDKA